MARVMVTGVGSNVAQGIISSVRAHDPRNWILGTDVAGLCAGYFMCDHGAQVPYAIDRSYIPEIIRLIERHKIDIALPGVDAELPVYAEHKDEIESKTGCRVVIGDSGLIKKCTDKYLTSLMLKDIGLNYPTTLVGTDADTALSRLCLPVVVKPRTGNGSRGVHIARSRDELMSIARTVPLDRYCFQEYLDGDEYTCGLLYDKNNRLSDSIIMRRELENGTTVKASIVEEPEIQSMIDNFGRCVRAFGSINLQLRLTGRGPVVFEINPRFSGTTAFRLKAGYNDVGRIIDNVLFDRPIPRSHTRKLHFFRYWETLVVDEEGVKNADIERVI